MSERGDIIDQANDRAAEYIADREADIRRAAAGIPAGEPGDCDRCGLPNPRLVNGACARCRDKYRLP
jgi:hypothetical protein